MEKLFFNRFPLRVIVQENLHQLVFYFLEQIVDEDVLILEVPVDRAGGNVCFFGYFGHWGVVETPLSNKFQCQLAKCRRVCRNSSKIKPYGMNERSFQ